MEITTHSVRASQVSIHDLTASTNLCQHMVYNYTGRTQKSLLHTWVHSCESIAQNPAACVAASPPPRVLRNEALFSGLAAFSVCGHRITESHIEIASLSPITHKMTEGRNITPSAPSIYSACHTNAGPIWFLLLAGCAKGLPLCSPVAETFQVTTTEEARALASALNCSGGGTFDALWQGTVVLHETIVVLAGSSLNVFDAGGGAVDAVASGNGTVQLFSLSSGASLNVTGLHFVNGTRAIQAFESVVTLRDTTFKGNEEFLGGAIEALNSSLTLSGESLFDANSAYYGAAVWSEGERSVFSWSGKTRFRNNEAIENGGALVVRDGSVSWSGDTSFEQNTGRWSGPGALAAEGSTQVSWCGTTLFEGNRGSLGGAIFFGGEVSATSRGNTTFIDNVSDTSGGPVVVSGNWSSAGFNSFVTNTAGNDGGAISMRGDNVEWEGDTYFGGNIARLSGGALSISGGGDVHFGGLTTLFNNTAVESGGAIWALLSSLEDDESTTIVFSSGSNTSFDQNHAGVYGGAMFLSGAESLRVWRFGITVVGSLPEYSLGGGSSQRIVHAQQCRYVRRRGSPFEHRIRYNMG